MHKVGKNIASKYIPYLLCKGSVIQSKPMPFLLNTVLTPIPWTNCAPLSLKGKTTPKYNMGASSLLGTPNHYNTAAHPSPFIMLLNSVRLVCITAWQKACSILLQVKHATGEGAQQWQLSQGPKHQGVK